MPPAYQKPNEPALDDKRLTREPARLVIPAHIAIDQALSQEAGYGILEWQCAMRRLFAKRFPFHLPLVVTVLEILEHDVWPVGDLGGRPAPLPAQRAAAARACPSRPLPAR